jgi:hypothetical protein
VTPTPKECAVKFVTDLSMKRVVMGCLCAVTLAAGACADGRESPTSPSAENPTAPSTSADAPSVAASSPRSGDFKLTKECSTYTGQAGNHCTVTVSDLKEIEIGTTFTYEQAVVNGVLNSDIVLDPPGPGNNQAFGHCRLNLATGLGQCTFSGGTGKFTHFGGSAAVSCPADDVPNCSVEGTYSFKPGN